jgi:hypothetical protein
MIDSIQETTGKSIVISGWESESVTVPSREVSQQDLIVSGSECAGPEENSELEWAKRHMKEEEEKKRKEPPKEEPPKEDKDPKVIRIKSYRVNLNKEPDWFSDPIRVLMRNQEVELIEEQGFWQKVRDVNSGDEGWIHRTTTTEKKLDWSKAENLSGKAGPVTADEVMEGGRG